MTGVSPVRPGGKRKKRREEDKKEREAESSPLRTNSSRPGKPGPELRVVAEKKKKGKGREEEGAGHSGSANPFA